MSVELNEFYERWKNRKIRSPYTGNTVKVGSLPPKDQERFKPFEFEGNPENENKPDENKPDEYDVENKYVFDFYVSVPKECETLEDYLSANELIPVTTDSGYVVDMFPRGERVLKFKGVPVTSVKKYFDLKEDGSNKEEATFRDIPNGDDPQKVFDFLRYNEFKIYAINVDDCIDSITIINDTPDDEGFVLKQKEDDAGVLEMFNQIFGKRSILAELESIERDTQNDRKVEPEEVDITESKPREKEVARAVPQPKPEPKPAPEPTPEEEDRVEIKQDVINFQELVAQQENMIQTLSDIQRAHFNIRELLKSHTIDGFVKSTAINKSNMERYLSEYKMMYRDLLSAYTTVSDVLDRLDKNVNELTKTTTTIRT